jgi:hypothetical protein
MVGKLLVFELFVKNLIRANLPLDIKSVIPEALLVGNPVFN